MARTRRVPKAGRSVFEIGPLLEKDAAVIVENQDMYCTVKQTQSMYLAARRTADRLVAFIYHIEKFFVQ